MEEGFWWRSYVNATAIDACIRKGCWEMSHVNLVRLDKLEEAGNLR